MNGTFKFRHWPWTAACLVANCDATGPYCGNGGRLGRHRKPEEHPVRYHKYHSQHSAYAQPAQTHAQDRPEAYLERHDRLADLLERPRRQRHQLRREGDTGSDRRLRETVPRKQHRLEQLQPLQRHSRSFEKEERTRACCRWWRPNPCCALSRGGVPPRVCRACQGVAVDRIFQ